MTRNVALTFVVRLVRIALGLVASVLTARALGPSGRGDYYFVVTFAALLVQFGHLGLASSNTYLVARERALLRPLVANSIWVSVMMGGGVGAFIALLILVGGLYPNVPGTLLWFAVALAPPSLFYLLGTNLLVGVGRIVAFNVIETFGNTVVLLLIVVAAGVSSGVVGFLVAVLVGWTLAAVALLIVLLGGHFSGLAFDRPAFLAGFRYAAKAYAITLLGFLVLRSNVFLLQSFAGSAEVGFYSIAAQIADVLIIFPTSVALVLFPDLVRNAGTRWSAMVRTAVVVAVVITAACLVAALLAGPLITLLYGEVFRAAVPALLLMLPGVVFVSVTTICSQYLAAIGLPRALLLVWAVALLALVSLNLVVTPALGAVGAAAALSSAYLLLLVLVGALAFRHREIES